MPRRKLKRETAQHMTLCRKPVVLNIGVRKGHAYAQIYSFARMPKGTTTQIQVFVLRSLTERESHALFHDLAEAVGYRVQERRGARRHGDVIVDHVPHRGRPGSVLIAVPMRSTSDRRGTFGNIAAIVSAKRADKLVQMLAPLLGWRLYEIEEAA